MHFESLVSNVIGGQNEIVQKQPFRDVLRKRFFENMQQIYRRKLIPKCNFNKIALLLD